MVTLCDDFYLSMNDLAQALLERDCQMSGQEVGIEYADISEKQNQRQ
jgi:hypothetical protein